MSQAILNNAKLCNAAAVMVAPILQNLRTITRLVELNLRRLRDAAEIAIRFAEFHALTYYRPVAGLYIWVRLSQICSTKDDEEAIVERCALQGALIGSGTDYAEPQSGWFRLTFALPQDQFLEGLRRIEQAMGYNKRFNWASRPNHFWGISFTRCWKKSHHDHKGQQRQPESNASQMSSVK